MNANDCRSARQEIDQSELGQRLSESGEAHVANCSSCATFRSERAHLRELVGSLRPVTAPADFEVRLRARMARERSSASGPFIFRVVMSTPAIAVAAAVVIIVASYVFVSQRKQTAISPEVAIANQPAQSAAHNVDVNKEPPSTSQNSPVLAVDAQKLSSRSRKPATVPVTTANDFSRATDFSSRSAAQFKLGQERNGEVSLTAPANPTVVSVYDANGRERKILLPPISFGSQRLTDTRTPVSLKNTRDW